MSTYKPRRPAQLKPEQVELIAGNADTAANSELSHTTAQAVVPLGQHPMADADVIVRVKTLIVAEGIDVIAQSWADAPAESLPGILWRGYLLREWIRRFPDVVRERLAAARLFAHEQDTAKLKANSELVPGYEDVLALWDEVFRGDFRGDFANVLRSSARFTDFLAHVEPAWIDDDAHPLATYVTRRDTAMRHTAQEFFNSGELLIKGSLE
ncbi:hypothetical protein JOD55_000031 [Arcanobacterium pluranimalium]|uniref:hypothetical protein n=1 Tax=Arcanobacterium pluranimalium TaxID=108028 RepID=UPI00195E3E12|nr:hypothetical protein [Arcanobacterium pluranimalium]MBM7824204.1 hypothetical protein [Arcanobacterium pluranimalium]